MSKFVCLPEIGCTVEIKDDEKNNLFLRAQESDSYGTEESQELIMKYLPSGVEVVLSTFGYYEDALEALKNVTATLNNS